jgi:Glycine-zipper domain
MKRTLKTIGAMVLGSILFHVDLSLAQSAEPFAYPSKGQSQEQQQQDHYACYSWAKQQTGVDPSQPNQISPATAAQSSQQGQVVREAARGALLGTVGGAIAGNTGEGAAIGAGVGALARLFKKQDTQQQAQQAQNQATPQEHQQLQKYYEAGTACMEGGGYSVQ